MLVLPPEVKLTERLADKAVHDYSSRTVSLRLKLRVSKLNC